MCTTSLLKRFLLFLSIAVIFIGADKSSSASAGECLEHDEKTGQCKVGHFDDESKRRQPTQTNKKSSACLTVAVTPNSTGLFHDAAVWKMYVGSEVSLFTTPATARTVDCQVRIFLEETPSYVTSLKNYKDEKIHKDWISVRRNWVVINPDMFHDEILHQPGLELVLCKTHQCVEFIKKARIRLNVQVPILYIGFTSIIDDVAPKESSSGGSGSRSPKKDFTKFLHIAGKSPFKGTVSIIQAWLRNPNWPKLTITSFDNMLLKVVLENFYKEGNKLPSNLEHIDRKLRPEEIAQIRHNHSVHLCTSSMEGFGHYINEARAVGALIVSTDYPAMNEFFVDDPTSGILVKPAKFEKWQTYMNAAIVDAVGIQGAVDEILSMTQKDRAAMGARAKESYEKDRDKFAKLAKKLKCLASRKSCNDDENLVSCAAKCGILHFD